jgi:prepilin-type N-terminal cleavage/methylation domain-containing protein
MRKRLLHERAPRRQRGYTMVELLVTVVLAGIVFASMVPFFLQAQERNSADNFRTMAVATAQDRAEKIRYLDYNAITETNLDATLGTARYIHVSGGTTRRLNLDYVVTLKPDGAVPGTEQYKVVKVDVWWDAPPSPVIHTIVQTEIYKQFAGPQIEDFGVLQGGVPVADFITANSVTLRARIAAADEGSMAGGKVAFSIMNAQGTVIASHSVSTPVGMSGEAHRTYEWAWDTTIAGDGLYNFRAIAYSGQSFQGNNWQLTYIIEKGPPPAPGPITVTPGNQVIVLEWPVSSATDIDHYQVFRNDTNDRLTAKDLGSTVLATTYVDTGADLPAGHLENGNDGIPPDPTYYYWVYAYDVYGKVSAAGTASGQAVEGSDHTKPTAAGSLTAVNGGSHTPTIVLNWTAATDPHGPPGEPVSGVAYYVIERASDAAFTVNKTTVNSGCTYPNVTWTDASAGYLKTWHYRLWTVDGNGNMSAAPSNSASATTEGPWLYNLTVRNTSASSNYKYSVQNNSTPSYYWLTNGTYQVLSKTYQINKGGSQTWSNLPADQYTVTYFTTSGALVASRTVDLTGGTLTINFP